jgi:hypothetical protein
LAVSEVVVREAKLFEVGSYRAQGVEVSEGDIDGVVSGFRSGGGVVPVRVQHTGTAFDGMMGVVKEIWRAGKDLMGRLEFPVAVWAFLEAMGTKKLSAGFARGSVVGRVGNLTEVSIVAVPAVLTARIFGDSIGTDSLLVFDDVFESSKVVDGGNGMGSEVSPELTVLLKAEREAGKKDGAAAAEVQFEARIGPLAQENAALKRRMATEAAAAKIVGWKLEGKLLPAAEKFAEALLVDGVAEVTFADGGHMSASEALVQFMTHQGKVLVTSGGDPTGPAVESSAKEKELFSLLGVTEADVEFAMKMIADPTVG